MEQPESLGQPAAVPPLGGYRILVVDDEEDVRTFLLLLFADAGASTLEAADGAEALEVARRERPDLITLDLSMPGTDGVEAYRQLKRDPDVGGTPVCVVTGHPEFRQVIYSRSESPPEGFVNKPVDGAELVNTVRRILGLVARRRHRPGSR